jgi:protein gp37
LALISLLAEGTQQSQRRLTETKTVKTNIIMSLLTNIQWCHSTVNPIMGCGGCELFRYPKTILDLIDKAAKEICDQYKSGHAKRHLKQCLVLYQMGAPERALKLSTTNIYHLRHELVAELEKVYGKAAADAALAVIEQSVTCYAAKLHLNKALSIVNPDRQANPGYAPTFEEVTPFPGRVAEMAAKSDLYGLEVPGKPWMKGLPRLIFVSDMGDAFSRESDAEFLKADVLPAIDSPEGQLHLWLWLTKRPKAMARFAKEIGGFPANVCAMTTLTCADSVNLRRVDHLRRIDAACRGLSIEPLRERIPASKLNLRGIDWVIVGGETGAFRNVHPFDLEWAVELRDHCREQGVAFFMKQFGRAPLWQGEFVRLKNTHGGDWEEWPEEPDLKIREFPAYFYKYRK